MILSVYDISHVNEWQHNDCIWHYTQCICVIKPTWLMTSHPMYVWNHTHCMHDTIGTLNDITSTLADNTPLFVCRGTHSVYDIICIKYDVTNTVCMTTQALYLTGKPTKTDISSTLYVITPSMLKTSHLQCKTSQVAYVCHYMHYTWHHIHTL